jgi:hypothetical protein
MQRDVAVDKALVGTKLLTFFFLHDAQLSSGGSAAARVKARRWSWPRVACVRGSSLCGKRVADQRCCCPMSRVRDRVKDKEANIQDFWLPRPELKQRTTI